jgi:hypothetical protein
VEKPQYQPTSFFAIVELIKEFERRNYYRTFTEHRRDFEEFILRHKEFANQVAGVIGSGTKGMKHLQLLYQIVLDGLVENSSEEEILQALFSERKFTSFLRNCLKKDQAAARRLTIKRVIAA